MFNYSNDINQQGLKMNKLEEAEKQIEQLTKERDELKEELIRESALCLRRLDINMKIQEQLQAEKQKVKEMREGVKKVKKLVKENKDRRQVNTIRKTFVIKELEKLLNQ